MGERGRNWSGLVRRSRFGRGSAQRFPQTAYAGLTMSLQHKWQYMARTVPNIGHLLAPMERWAIRQHFLPKLLGEEEILGEIRALLAEGVKRLV